MKKQRPVIEFTPTKLHELSERSMRPLIRFLHRNRLDPNLFTYASLAVALIVAVCIASGQWFLALVSLLINGWFDIIDGSLARRSQSIRSERLKQMGVFLDPAVDRVNDGLFFMGLLTYTLWQGYMYTKVEGLVNGYTAAVFIGFCLLIVASAIAHPISSYYRAKIESMDMRFQEKKPLTRATFHLMIAVVCVGMLVLPEVWAPWYFAVSVVLLVCAMTLGNWYLRFRRSIRLFDQVMEQKKHDAAE